MFQAQAKLNSIQFIHRNDVRRMDKTFSDERRIKQVLITVLSNSLNMISQGSIAFKVQLDRNDMQLSQSFAESPTSKSHPSLRFEIEITINEKKKKRDDVSEEFEQLFKKIENQVIDELVKTLGPYQIKTEDDIENNMTRISFSIYADFVNLRKEERLHSLIRPEISINGQDQNQRQRTSSKPNALTIVRQSKKSQDSILSLSSHLIGSQQNNTQQNIERSPIIKDTQSIIRQKTPEETQESILMNDKKRQIDLQIQQFQEENTKRQQEKNRNLSLSPINGGGRNNNGQKRSTTIRHGTNILNTQQHQSFLSSLGDTIIIHSQNGSQTHSQNENDVTQNNSRRNSQFDNKSNVSNKIQSGLENNFMKQQNTCNSIENCSDIKNKSMIEWQTQSGNLIEEENLRPSENFLDKETNIKQLQQSNTLGESFYQKKQISTYFSQKEIDQLLEGSNNVTNQSSKISPDKFIFMINSVEDNSSPQNYFLNEEKDSINESSHSSAFENSNLDFRVKKVSIFSPIR